MRAAALVVGLLLICAGCVAAASVAEPAGEFSPTPPARVALLRQPTLTPRAIVAPLVPPTVTPLSAASLPTAALPTAPVTPGAAASTADPAAEAIIGYSGGGRPLTARRFGSGDRVLLLVGGIHGGWEANTVRLMGELTDYFALHPQDVPPGVALVIVPVANPDGLARGRVWAGRLNANGVDLNRNWACNWSPTAYWQQTRVNPGLSAFSEPETQVLSAYVQLLRPAAALFYHSAANGVFAGACGGDHGSVALSAVYGAAAGYRYGVPFSAYPVTGTAADWLDGLGIPAADVELITSSDTEFARNLRGVLALMQWMNDNGE